jgi:hypothetical protein
MKQPEDRGRFDAKRLQAYNDVTVSQTDKPD